MLPLGLIAGWLAAVLEARGAKGWSSIRSAETVRCIPPGLIAGWALEGESEQPRASLLGTADRAVSRDVLGQWHDHCSFRALPEGAEVPLPNRVSGELLPGRESVEADVVGEEGAAGLGDAPCLDRARALSAVRGEEASEVEPPGPLVVAQGLIAAMGEEVREVELRRQIAASGDLTAARGDAVSEMELLLQTS
jgi:hypothetical protein